VQPAAAAAAAAAAAFLHRTSAAKCACAPLAMGGIKNREAKKAANKVFSGGGGGGTKGPATLDKRGQELACPHCERVFKQPGRLTDHVKTRHGKGAADGFDDGAALGAGGAAPAPPKPPPPKPPATRVMDVNARAGAYDAKSPKLLLQEELARAGAPRARYKAAAGADGRWRCKVVLPHAKVAEKDVVIFLDGAHAAATEDEAAQRAAVAALHRLAGERALERVLPREYAAQWRALGEAAAAAEARAAAEAERRRRGAAAAAAALRRPAPKAVVMADGARRLVEDVLSAARAEAGEGEDFGAGGGGFGEADAEGWEALEPEGGGGAAAESAEALVQELAALGFAEAAARRSAAALGGRATLADALDWLCLRLPEAELPTNFAPGASGGAARVIRAGAARPATPADDGDDAEDIGAGGDDASLLEDPSVAELASFGWPPALAAGALAAAGGHAHRALAALAARLAAAAASRAGDDAAVTARPESAADASADAPPPAARLEEWLEERVALEAVFGAEAVTFHSETWTSMRLTVILAGGAAAAAGAHCGAPPEALMVDGAELELHAWAPLEGDGAAAYPRAPPALALRSPHVAPATLLTLTARLAALAARRREPMLHELAAAAEELLPECLLRPRGAAALLRGRPDAPAAGAADAAAALDGLALDDSGGAAAAPRRPRAPRAAAPAIDVAAESRRLAARQRELDAGGGGGLTPARRRLPAHAARAQVLAALAASRVVVVSGATGCGKSTQVPQFILEDAIARDAGGACNIVITQPRRISAVALAARVAAERGEKAGEVAGHSVRLDSKRSARTRLLFCTTGVLLRRLASDTGLVGTTHVVLDEVHERSIESDLLLMLLRRAMAEGACIIVVLVSLF
jgi:ATP-dependent RNA helicase DHX57